MRASRKRDDDLLPGLDHMAGVHFRAVAVMAAFVGPGAMGEPRERCEEPRRQGRERSRKPQLAAKSTAVMASKNPTPLTARKKLSSPHSKSPCRASVRSSIIS